MDAVQLAKAAVAGVLSLGLTAGYLENQFSQRQLMLGGYAQVAAPPPEVPLPKGMVRPNFRKATAQDWATGVRLIVEDPLEQRLLNWHYAQRAGELAWNSPQLNRERVLLGKLGWRHTPSQQNLLLPAALTSDGEQLLDRVDSLLRRGQIVEPAFRFLDMVETLPAARRVFIERLQAKPSWRPFYMKAAGQMRDPRQQTARISTFNALLTTPSEVERAEIGPFLNQLVTSGRGEEAYRLWLRYLGRSARSPLFDGTFAHAQEVGSRPETSIPFEWQFAYGPGFSTRLASGRQGVAIRSDGSGVPVLMSQFVRVRPGRSYLLEVTSDTGGTDAVARRLDYALICGNERYEFQFSGQRDNLSTFTAAVPATACPVPQFTLAPSLAASASRFEGRLLSLALEEQKV